MGINIDNLDSNLLRSKDCLFNDDASDNLQELSAEELKISGGHTTENETISIAISGEEFTIDGDGVNVIVPEAVANSDRFKTFGDDIDVITYKGGPQPIYYGSISIKIVGSNSFNSPSPS